MEVVLLGTGGARGWPEPGCTCASCRTAAVLRLSRAPTSVLVDGVLLLDPGQGADRAAAAVGHSLAGVRQVLLSGLHEGPVPERAEVLGPQAAAAGVHGYDVRAVAHGAGVAWDVAAPDGTRLLYAPGTGVLRDLPGPYDLVLLGGDRASALAALRASGAVAPTADVVAVGLGHDDPSAEALERQLAAWGVRAVPDGATVGAGEAPPLSGRTLVLGGVRSGKSALAEQLLAACPDVTYVATGGARDGDAEWQQRVAAHVLRRPPAWLTVETTDVARWLREAQGPLLVDCLGTWLTARLDHHDVWTGAPATAVDDDVDELVAAWRAAVHPVVAVSNEVGSGVVPATTSGRLFRDLLGRLNVRIAAESESVLLTVAGFAVPLRGG